MLFSLVVLVWLNPPLVWLNPPPVPGRRSRRSLEDNTPLELLADEHLAKDHRGGYVCKICGKVVRDKYAGKNHLEGKHFPTDGAYSCNKCGKKMNTRKALSSHQDHCNYVKPTFTGHHISNYI